MEQQLASERKKIATLNLFTASEKKKILVLTEPLLTNEDYNVRIVGMQLLDLLASLHLHWYSFYASFLEEICFNMESWEVRHTGVMIVYHITVLIGSASLLPYLSFLMEIIEPRLKDNIERVRDVTTVTMDGLAKAATL
ncbi:hypothetical protein H5410_053903, partial [Solanum commersonii]